MIVAQNERSCSKALIRPPCMRYAVARALYLAFHELVTFCSPHMSVIAKSMACRLLACTRAVLQSILAVIKRQSFDT